MAIGLLFAFRGGDHGPAFNNSSILARKRQLGLSSTHFSLFYTHADAAKPSRVECPLQEAFPGLCGFPVISPESCQKGIQNCLPALNLGRISA
jgi:hypothetical protein